MAKSVFTKTAFRGLHRPSSGGLGGLKKNFLQIFGKLVSFGVEHDGVVGFDQNALRGLHRPSSGGLGGLKKYFLEVSENLCRGVILGVEHNGEVCFD